MNSKTSQIALRIALLREEFTENDILEAVKFLEEQGSSSALLSYLAGRKREPKASKAASRKSKPIEEQRSKAVIDLEHKDPEKYNLLSEFDLLLRRGNVLSELDDINRFGKRLSKEFASKSSRREMVSKFMALLAARPIEEIQEVIRAALSSARVDNKDEDYQRLAQFIITGRTPKASP